MSHKVLTIPALADFLRSRKGAEFVTVVSTTRPKVLKFDRSTGEPNWFGTVVKVSRANGIVGFRYENAVNNQRTREGSESDFVAQPRRWGQHVLRADGGMSPLVEHNGRQYLEIKVERSLGTTYFDEKGTERTHEELAGILPASRKDSGRQELDKPVILRDYALANIREIRIGGENILVAP